MGNVRSRTTGQQKDLSGRATCEGLGLAILVFFEIMWMAGSVCISSLGYTCQQSAWRRWGDRLCDAVLSVLLEKPGSSFDMKHLAEHCHRLCPLSLWNSMVCSGHKWFRNDLRNRTTFPRSQSNGASVRCAGQKGLIHRGPHLTACRIWNSKLQQPAWNHIVVSNSEVAGSIPAPSCMLLCCCVLELHHCVWMYVFSYE